MRDPQDFIRDPTKLIADLQNMVDANKIPEENLEGIRANIKRLKKTISLKTNNRNPIERYLDDVQKQVKDLMEAHAEPPIVIPQENSSESTHHTSTNFKFIIILQKLIATVGAILNKMVIKKINDNDLIQDLIFVVSHLESIRHFLENRSKGSTNIFREIEKLSYLIEPGKKLISQSSLLSNNPEQSKDAIASNEENNEATTLSNEDNVNGELEYFNEQQNLGHDFKEFLQTIWAEIIDNGCVSKKIFISYAWPTLWQSIYLIKSEDALDKVIQKFGNQNAAFVILAGENDYRTAYFYIGNHWLQNSNNKKIRANLVLNGLESKILQPQLEPVIIELEKGEYKSSLPDLNKKIHQLIEQYTQIFVRTLASHLSHAGLIVSYDLQTSAGQWLNTHMSKIKEVHYVMVISTRTLAYKLKREESGIFRENGLILERQHFSKIPFIIPVLLTNRNYCTAPIPKLVEIRFERGYLHGLRQLITDIYGFNKSPDNTIQSRIEKMFMHYSANQTNKIYQSCVMMDFNPKGASVDKFTLAQIQELLCKYCTQSLTLDKLIDAIKNHDIELIIILLNIAKNIAHHHDSHGWNAYHWAAYYDKSDVIELLWEHYPELIISKTKEPTAYFSFNAISGETSLHIALKNKKFSAFKTIVDKYQPALNEIDKLGNTPLHLCAEKGLIEFIEYAISKGASISQLNSQNRSPLDMCKNKELQDKMRADYIRQQNANKYKNDQWNADNKLIPPVAKSDVNISPTFSHREAYNSWDRSLKHGKHSDAIRSIRHLFARNYHKIFNLDQLFSESVNKEEINLFTLLCGLDLINIKTFIDGTHGFFWSLTNSKRNIFKLLWLYYPDQHEIITDDNQNVLHIAVRYGQLEAIETLVLFNSNPTFLNTKRSDGRTAAQLASDSGNNKAIKYLAIAKQFERVRNVSYGLAEIANDIDNDGWSVFHYAAKYDQVDIIKILWEHYPPAERNRKTRKGWVDGDETILHLAARFRAENVLKFILDKKYFSLDEKTKANKTALSWALSNKDVKCVHLLALYGAVIKGALIQAARDQSLNIVNDLLVYPALGTIIKETDEDGRNVIYWLAYHGQLDKDPYKKLYNNYPEEFVRKSDTQETVLHAAASQGQHSVIQYILSLNPCPIDINDATTERKTALDFSVEARDWISVNYLIEKGAIKITTGTLSKLAVANKFEVIKYLLEKNNFSQSDLNNEIDSYGWSVFHYAASLDQIAIIELLWKKHINEKNRRTKEGWIDGNETLLHIAARYNAENVLAFILNKQCFLLSDTAKGNKTPLSWSLTNKNEKCFRLLAKHGADVKSAFLHAASTRDHNAIKFILSLNPCPIDVDDATAEGKTAFDLTVVNSDWINVKYLLQKGARKIKLGILSTIVNAEKFDIVRELMPHLEHNRETFKYEMQKCARAILKNTIPHNEEFLDVFKFFWNTYIDERNTIIPIPGFFNNSSFETLMHKAVAQDADKILAFMLNNGGDINKVNSDCLTPLEYANKHYKDGKCIVLLKEKTEALRKQNLSDTALCDASTDKDGLKRRPKDDDMGNQDLKKPKPNPAQQRM